MRLLVEENDVFIRIAFFVLLFITVPIVLEWAFNRLVPVGYWIEYDELVVLPSVHASDSTIDVYSFAEIKRPVFVQWSDKLFCAKGQGLEFVVSNESSSQYTNATILPRSTIGEKTGQPIDIPWRFRTKGALEAGDECQIVSTVCVNNKCFDVKSNIFYVYP